MTKYAVNQTQTTIGITGLGIEIPIGGWVELEDEQTKHKEIAQSVRRGWIRLSLVEPKEAEARAPIVFTEPETVGSKTPPAKKKKVAA